MNTLMIRFDTLPKESFMLIRTDDDPTSLFEKDNKPTRKMLAKFLSNDIFRNYTIDQLQEAELVRSCETNLITKL